jgi:AcrR family transcriptional regulator
MVKAGVDRFEQRKATRSKLIEAAQQLFSTSGYEHATVDDISHAAGYSKGAYYFHFSTKDDILLELLRIWTEGRTAVLPEEPSERLSADELRETLADFFSYADEPQWPGVLLEFWAQAMRNNEVSKRLTQAYAVWRKRITAAFEAAARDGLRVESANDAASVVLAAHDGLAVPTVIGSPGSRAMTAAELADSVVTPLETAVEQAERRTIAM